MTITNDTIDATIATLRETRDGLLVTEEEEKKQHDDKIAGLVKIAHEWADKNGMNDSVEEMLEELGLPGRAPHRHMQVGSGDRMGWVWVHLFMPDASGVTTPGLERYGSSVAMSQMQYVTASFDRGRNATTDCICTFDPLLAGYNLDSRITAAVAQEYLVSIEADLSCDSPNCHHGYPEVEPTEAGESQPCTIADHSSREHYHWTSPNNLTRVYEGAVGRTQERNTIRSVNTFIKVPVEGEVAGEASEEGPKTYTRAQHPELFRVLPASAQSAVVHVADSGRALAVLDAGGWRFDSGDRRGEGEGLPESLIGERYCYWIDEEYWAKQVERDAAPSTTNQPCDVTTHPAEEHLHVTDMWGVLMHARLDFEKPSTWTQAAGTFGGTPVAATNQPCSLPGHPNREHLHFDRGNGRITHARPDYDDPDSQQFRMPGTFGGTPVAVESVANQPCRLQDHPVGEHLHLRRGTVITHVALDTDLSGDQRERRLPGTFLKGMPNCGDPLCTCPPVDPPASSTTTLDDLS